MFMFMYIHTYFIWNCTIPRRASIWASSSSTRFLRVLASWCSAGSGHTSCLPALSSCTPTLLVSTDLRSPILGTNFQG